MTGTTSMFKSLSGDEKKFVWFWILVFSSALGFWTICVHWVWNAVAPYFT
jgi:hypothetical protein